jgi:hypothetical protein
MTGLSASRNGGTCPSQITLPQVRSQVAVDEAASSPAKDCPCQGIGMLALAAVTRSWNNDLVERCELLFARNILTVKGTFYCSYPLARHRSTP